MKTLAAIALLAASYAVAANPASASPQPTSPALDRLGIVVTIENAEYEQTARLGRIGEIMRETVERAAETVRKVRCRITRDC